MMVQSVPRTEAERLAELKHMRRLATGLLVLASVIFVIAHILEDTYPWLAFVRATAEAGMIGGLADWFAVTALFRHPLGIPIPHTAIVKKQKDRIGQTLGNFVQGNFLNPDNIRTRLKAARVTEYLAGWVSQPENARTLARHIGSAMATGARTLRDEDVEELIHATVVRKVEDTPAAPLIGSMLSLLTADNRHQEILDESIKLLAKGVAENRQIIRDRIQAESPWWLPDPVEEKIYKKIVRGIETTLNQIRDNPEHPIRERFDEALRKFIDDLHNSPSARARAEAIKYDVIDAAVTRRFAASLWQDARESLIRHAEKPESATPDAIEKALLRLGDTVLADEELMKKVDQGIVDVAEMLAERFREEVAGLIADTVAGWDPEATSNRIELAVGSDLQYIRINGTLVGGLAGLIIYTISLLF